MAERKLYGIVARAGGRIAATVGGKEAGWRGKVDVPTFFLDADIQGIVDAEHAGRVAKKVIDPLDLLDLNIVVTPPEEL